MRQRIGSIFRFVKQTFTITSAVGSRKIQVVRAVDKMWLSKFPKDSECHSVILTVAKVVLLLFCFCSVLFIQIWVQKLKFYFLVYTCLWNHWLHIQHACMNACSVTSVVPDSLTPWTVVPQAISPWDSPGKNTGVSCHFLLHVYNQGEMYTCFSLYHISGQLLWNVYFLSSFPIEYKLLRGKKLVLGEKSLFFTQIWDPVHSNQCLVNICWLNG